MSNDNFKAAIDRITHPESGRALPHDLAKMPGSGLKRIFAIVVLGFLVVPHVGRGDTRLFCGCPETTPTRQIFSIVMTKFLSADVRHLFFGGEVIRTFLGGGVHLRIKLFFYVLKLD